MTAVEIDPKIAKVYQDFFPDDKVILEDAHQYLLDHHKKYDFIWSSPPCPTHSVANQFLNAQGIIRYPDMKLYEEIIFLNTFFRGLYCVENVVSYYKPLIKPKLIDRHYFWSNFYITPFRSKRDFNINYAKARAHINSLEGYHGILLPKEVINKRLLLRNCVYPPLGKHVLDCAKRNIQLTFKDFSARARNEGGEVKPLTA